MVAVSIVVVVVVIVAVGTGGALRMTCMVVMRSVVAEGVVVTFRTPGAAVTGAASVTARAVLAAAAMVALVVVMAIVALVAMVPPVIAMIPMVMVVPVIPVIPMVVVAPAMVIVRTTRRTGWGILLPSGGDQCNGPWNGGRGGMQGWMHAFRADMCRGQRTRCEQAGNACQQEVSDEFHDYLPGAGRRLMTTGIGPGRAGAR